MKKCLKCGIELKEDEEADEGLCIDCLWELTKIAFPLTEEEQEGMQLTDTTRKHV